MSSVTVLGQRRAVAGLDATIGRDPAPLRAVLRLTEDYLACLRQSRGILLWELPPEEPGLSTAAGATGATGDARPRLAE